MHCARTRSHFLEKTVHDEWGLSAFANSARELPAVRATSYKGLIFITAPSPSMKKQ